MKKWEYKILIGAQSKGLSKATIESEKLELSFNELGKQGWEFIRSENTFVKGWTDQVLFIFRREII